MDQGINQEVNLKCHRILNENEIISIPKSIGQKKTVLKEKLIGLSAYIKNFQINDLIMHLKALQKNKEYNNKEYIGRNNQNQGWS